MERTENDLSNLKNVKNALMVIRAEKEKNSPAFIIKDKLIVECLDHWTLYSAYINELPYKAIGEERDRYADILNAEREGLKLIEEFKDTTGKEIDLYINKIEEQYPELKDGYKKEMSVAQYSGVATLGDPAMLLAANAQISEYNDSNLQMAYDEFDEETNIESGNSIYSTQNDEFTDHGTETHKEHRSRDDDMER